MIDQARKSEDQHRIDTLQEMANTEHQLRMARTQYETAKGELVRACEALLEWQEQWNKERRAVFACYPDAMPVDSVVEDARAAMDRFCAEIEARHAAYGKPAPITNEWHGDYVAEQETAREQLEREPEIPEGFYKWPPQFTMAPSTTLEFWWSDGKRFVAFADKDWTEPADAYRIIESSPVADEQDDASGFADEDPTPAAIAAYIEAQNAEPDEAPALNADMQDDREQPVQTEPDGYAPVTSPEADTIARAHEYYSPEKMGDRNRSVFDIFRHKREDA